MLVGAVLVRFFFFRFLLHLCSCYFFNHVVFLLSASRSINCAASSERTIAIIVCMFCGPIVLAHGCYMTREFRREESFTNVQIIPLPILRYFILRPLVFGIRSFLLVSVSLFRLNSSRRETVTFVLAFV